MSKDMDPSITIAVVAKNEEKYLPDLLEDIQNQTYSHSNIEVLLIDSLSNDKTRDIMEEFKNKNLQSSCSKKFRDVKIFENQKEKQAAGWNIAIKNFSSDILVRIDAHAHIPKDFIVKNVEKHKKGEVVTGGPRPCINENEGSWTNMLLGAENSIFGVSISPFRKSQKEQYVKSLFHAAYDRKVIETVGLFNEDLGRTEDNDFNYRVREAGYRLYYSPEIVSYQYSRPTLIKMINQKYSNGYWIGKTIFLSPKCLSIVYFIPFLFVLSLIIGALLVIPNIIWPITLILFSYFILLCLILIGFILDKTEKKKLLFFFLPFVVFLLHISYGIGTIVGIFSGLRNWNRESHESRR